jgi:signal transduction histidine kinase
LLKAQAQVLWRAIFVVGAALLLGGLFAQTTLYPRLVWWLEDTQQRWHASPLPLDHVLVFDVDEGSMQRLEPELGAWPYGRGVYANAMGFFAEHGARAVVFDILFSEAREGDDGFARSLHRRSVLAAAALPFPLRRAPDYHRQLGGVALPGASLDPRTVSRAPAWPDITLPLAKFTRDTEARVGVISVVADDDSLVRRLPMLHQTYGTVLPALPLAALLASEPGTSPLASRGELRLGSRSWPIAADGSVRLRFPSNSGALPVVPFAELVAAASRAPGTAHLGDLVRGKIVFVGSSSAVLGDYAFTPVGRLPGLQLNALIAELLIENQVLRPAMAWLDALLLALALAVPVALVVRAGAARPRDFALGLAAIVAVVAGAGIAMFAAGQSSAWLFALLAGAAAQAFALVAWLFALYQERQRLHFEALAAQEANRMKGEFLNHMTHELRTPITAIIGFNKINQFTDELGRDSRVRNSETIARNCDYVLALVNNQLDMARMEAGQLAIERKPADVSALLEEVAATMRVVAQQKGLALQLLVPGLLPPALLLDAFRLRQVLLNLLGNAVKFTERGTVALEARWDVDGLLLTVRDTGSGIAPQNLERIFEPFQRMVGERVPGTGLGLTITRKLVELMGGSIRASSVVGGGTTFEARIPAPVATPAAPERPPAPARAAPPLAGRVLVAEDNESLRMLVELQLRDLGLEFRTVANGLEAVEAGVGGDFDAVLMDLEMPLMDGYEATRVLRERGFRGPILAFTAHGEGPDVERAMREGCDGTVRKPTDAERLRAALEQLLAGKRRTRPAAAAHPVE